MTIQSLVAKFSSDMTASDKANMLTEFYDRLRGTVLADSMNEIKALFFSVTGRELAKTAVRQVMNNEVLFSDMSGKLAGMLAINCSPLFVPFCVLSNNGGGPKQICSACYSCKQCKTYRKSINHRLFVNGLILATQDLGTVTMPRVPMSYNAPIRIHAHGEFINRLHYNNMVEYMTVQCDQDSTLFGVWTKRSNYVDFNAWSNVVMLYSNPVVDATDRPIPPGFDKCFTVITDKTDSTINCGGNKCLSCLRCYDFRTESQIVEYLK